MNRLLSIFALLLLASTYSAAPLVRPQSPCSVTVDPDRASVADAVDDADDGDVICLNAGNETYDTEINITEDGTKAVEIRGAGDFVSVGAADQTVITIENNSAFGGPQATGSSFYPTVSNIKFVMNASTTDGVAALGNSTTAGHGPPFIWHHNTVDITPAAEGSQLICILVGSKNGLIYRNRFVNHPAGPVTTNQSCIKHTVTDADGSYWASASTFGDDDADGEANLYIEKNYFESFAVAGDQVTSSRAVWRFNEFRNASPSDHGFDSSAQGNRQAEFYKNDFVCDDILDPTQRGAWIAKRGGTGYIVDNTFDALDMVCGYPDGGGKMTQFDAYRTRQCVEIPGWPGSAPNTYPMGHQLGWGWIDGSTTGVGSSSAQGIPGGAGFAQDLEPMYIAGNADGTAGAYGIVTNSIGTCRAMGYSAQSKASSTTTVSPSVYANAGQYLVAAFVDLINTGTRTISDSEGHTWTALTTGTNGSMKLSAWYTKVTTDTALTVTVTHSSSTAARAISVVAIRGLVGSSVVDVNPAVATDNTTTYDSTSTGTMSSGTKILIGYFGLNWAWPADPNGFATFNAESPSLDASSYDNQWAGANLGRIGTSGGSDTDNVVIGMTYEVTTDTTAHTAKFRHFLGGGSNPDGLAGVVALMVDGTATELDLQPADFIQEDREVYVQDSMFDGTSGTGSGARASRPATCTTGVAWWATDQGSWNTSGSGGQGVLDKCTATNTWTNAAYVPYEYPHPLATVEGADVDDEVTVVATDDTAAEAASATATFTVTRDNITTGTVTVNLLWSGTATLTTDYAVSTSGMDCSLSMDELELDIADDGDGQCPLIITPVDDEDDDDDETVIVTIDDGMDYNVGTPDSATATITDNDTPPAGPSAQTHCTPFTVASAQVPAEQTNFTVLIEKTDNRFKTIANGGNVHNGNDLRPYSDEGVTPITAYEKEYYSGTAGTFRFWVKPPTIDVSDVIYMCYGDSDLDMDESSTDAWDSSYVLVAHMGDGSTLSLADSTSNNNDLTNNNATTAAAGKTGGAASFVAASSQSLTVGSAVLTATPITITAWFKTSTSDGHVAGLGSHDSGDLHALRLGGTNDIYAESNNAGVAGNVAEASGSFTNDAWTHGAAVFANSTSRIIYRDGGNSGSNSTDITPNQLSRTVIGARFDEGLSSFFNGQIDEVRFSNVARSANWITTEYNNVGDNAAFWTMGTEVAISSGGPKRLIEGGTLTNGGRLLNRGGNN